MKLNQNQINEKVDNLYQFVRDNPTFQKNMDCLYQLMEPANVYGYDAVELFVKQDDGFFADTLLKRWKELLVEQK